MNWHANSGVSFGLFPGFPLWIFFVLIFLMLYFIVIYKMKFDSALSLFMAGVSGNLVDRIRLGYVIDWIPLPFPFMERLYINVADVALIIGFLLFVFKELKKSSYKEPD